MPNSYSDLAARIRVPMGLVLGAVYVVFAKPTATSLLWGSVIAFAGLLLRAAGTGYLAKNQVLATGGPYRYTRHPLYLGSALAGIGYCIAGGRWWFFVLLFAFLGGVYWPVIRREESRLREIFPEYKDYAAAVGFLRLMPSRYISRQAPPSFSWRQYWKNREYQASEAFLAIIAVLVVKLFHTDLLSNFSPWVRR